MGKLAQKRLVRKLDLELFLSQIEPNPIPQAILEQYTISESVAATMLYISAYSHNDIIGKNILDLACGTGRLALGAAFLGAKEVVGVDIDRTAIQSACMNYQKTGCQGFVQWVTGDIRAITGKFDTVLQNPPFGIQKRAADRKFLEKALEIGNAVYSLHNHPTADKHLFSLLKKSGENLLQIEASPFMKRFVEEHGGTVKSVFSLLMTIPKMFDFHTKAKHQIIVDLYVIGRKVYSP